MVNNSTGENHITDVLFVWMLPALDHTEIQSLASNLSSIVYSYLVLSYLLKTEWNLSRTVSFSVCTECIFTASFKASSESESKLFCCPLMMIRCWVTDKVLWVRVALNSPYAFSLFCDTPLITFTGLLSWDFPNVWLMSELWSPWLLCPFWVCSFPLYLDGDTPQLLLSSWYGIVAIYFCLYGRQPLWQELFLRNVVPSYSRPSLFLC